MFVGRYTPMVQAKTSIFSPHPQNSSAMSNRIKPTHIQAVIERVNTSSDEQLEKLLDDMSAQQPDLLEYAMATVDELPFEDDDAHEEYVTEFLVGVLVIWMSYESVGKLTKVISQDTILKRQDEYEKLLLSMEKMKESEMGKYMSQIQIAEEEIEKFVEEALLYDDSGEPRFDEEAEGRLYVCFKILTDCLDKAR